jgi:choline dehydrogenase-like flavoprotein
MENKFKKKAVVIGAGTAGLIIANNLQKSFNVTVLEKSNNYKLPLIYRIPLLIGILFRKRKKNFIKKKIINIDNNRKIPIYYPNVIGGSSEINGCVHVFGSKKLWQIFLKKFQLTYKDLTKVYNETFNYKSKNFKQRKINLMDSFNNKLDTIFSRISKDFKIKKISSIFNDNIGYGKVVNNSNIYFRSSVLDLVFAKKFKIKTNSCVNKILKKIENGETVYYIYSNNGIFKADILILSLGTFATSQLLLNSTKTILELKRLKKLIGKGIKDHPNLRINVLLKRNFGTLNEISDSFLKKCFITIKFFFKFRTLLTGTGATSAFHIKLNQKQKNADTRINLLQFSENGRHDSKNLLNTNPGFSLSVTPVQSYSQGKILINDNGKNFISFKYFKDRRDYIHIMKSLNYCLKLLKNKNINKYTKSIDKLNLIKKNPKKYILNNVYSGGHWIGGSSKIINSNFQVKNLKNFYICDASIFDFHVSSNIHSSVILIANLFTKKILEKYK